LTKKPTDSNRRTLSSERTKRGLRSPCCGKGELNSDLCGIDLCVLCDSVIFRLRDCVAGRRCSKSFQEGDQILSGGHADAFEIFLAGVSGIAAVFFDGVFKRW